MRATLRASVTALLLLVPAQLSWAQTADEVLERSLTAMGGRAAFAKVKSRSSTGTITVSTPGGSFNGSIEVLNAAPNKLRSLVQLDLSAVGAGALVLDTRFDGTSGYAMDSLQGNRDISGNQLENLRNGSFPHLFLTYKQIGIVVKLTGKEKVGERDAFVLTFEPASGSIVRHYIDAETFLPIKFVMNMEIPQLGREVEQTTEFADYREVDGVKLAFRVTNSSAVQSYTVTVTKVEHNVTVDEKLFMKPAAQ